MIEELEIKYFKRITNACLPLSKINMLVGGNNSGKSCILQGIHFGITLSQTRKISGSEQFPPEKLTYCPTDDFLDLRNDRKLTEGSAIEFSFTKKSGNNEGKALVKLQRGRNGVVKAQSSSDNQVGGELLDQISNPSGFFSIYVPGLAGVTIREEYRSDRVVSNGIARGDANLYLRNVLLRIQNNPGRKKLFDAYLDQVFPSVKVNTEFNQEVDLWIKSTVSFGEDDSRPLDMVGTGLLQAIQLIAYVSNYEPKLLLLDEPDAHLHPSNQRLLANALSVIVENTETKIVLATHSRHLLDAMSGFSAARLFWVQNGVAKIQEDWSDIAILMDLGALDRGESFLQGNFKYLVWTEDTDTRYIKVLLNANGFKSEEILIFSYKASSKIDSANLMRDFLSRIRPGVITIIHRDRDFMNNDEILRLKNKYGIKDEGNMKLFITHGSDIEHYFCDPMHISIVTGCDYVMEKQMVNDIIENNRNDLTASFINKRNEIKKDLYKNDPDNCPSINDLIPANNFGIEFSMGKKLITKIKQNLQDRGFNGNDLIINSDLLIKNEIKNLL